MIKFFICLYFLCIIFTAILLVISFTVLGLWSTADLLDFTFETFRLGTVLFLEIILGACFLIGVNSLVTFIL